MVTFSPREAFLRVTCWMDGHGGIGLDLRCKKCGTRIDVRPRDWRPRTPLGYRLIKCAALLLLCALYATVIAAAFSDAETVGEWLRLVLS